MKKAALLLTLAALLTACTGGGRDTCPKPVEDFITDLYQNYVFNPGELDSIADRFSPAVLDSLHRAYVSEYDGEFTLDDPGYAVWLFRTGQNGDFTQSLDSITADGGDLYTAHITEGGISCACQMHIVLTDDDTPLLLDFRNTCSE